tara:strand:+ start:93128 stop:93766 length:639 start_codon:yes stop_codon:yes gene_type:complete
MCFDIKVRAQVGELALDVAFKAVTGLTAIVGPSGCGKTSLLNMVAGLLRPDAGHIRVAGTTLFDSAAHIDVPPRHRRAGYVFQDGRLFPHMRVRENMLFGAPDATNAERRGDEGLAMTFDEVVAFLGIGHLLRRWPGTLSGGERQRVAIGRALLSHPRFLLMDEPLGALDVARRDEIMTVVEHIRDETGLPILYVSHDPAEVARLSSNIITI